MSGSSTSSHSDEFSYSLDVEKVGRDSDSDSDGNAKADVPVLSHAEQRRRKRKAGKELILNGPSSLAEKKRKTSNTTSNLNRRNSVWVGNLSFKTTADSLRTFFDGVGEITRVHMPTKAGSESAVKAENRGFAYVDFSTIEAKTAAIAKSEQPLLGRRLLIKDGDDFTGRPVPAIGAGDADATTDTNTVKSNPGTGHSKAAQKILRIQKQLPAPCLFLGNLSFETTEKSIRQLFEAHRSQSARQKGRTHEVEGETGSHDLWIRKVRLGTFEDSGLCKGFAFVDFTSTENATSALINPKNHRLDGRNIVVEYASPDAVRRGGAVAAQRQSIKGVKKMRPRGEILQKRAARMREEEHGEKVANAKRSAVIREKTERVKNFQAKQRSRLARGNAGNQEQYRSRPKPGAALAQAKRESAAIIPSAGKKIKF